MLKLPTAHLTTRRAWTWTQTLLSLLVLRRQLASSGTTSLRVRPTTPVPQTIHHQAIIQQISAPSTDLEGVSLALALAPTTGLMSTLTLSTLTWILRRIPTDKEHPLIDKSIHYTPRAGSTPNQLLPIQQLHVSSTRNHLEIISIHPPGCLRKAMRTRHLADLQLSFRQVAFTQICPITHPRLRQQ
jgi:hypothetical protein